MPLFPDLLQYGDLGMLALRLAVGLVFVVHGLPKVMRPAGMAKKMNWPNGAAMFLGLVELLSGVALILGVYAQLGALLIVIVMLGALYHKIVLWKMPFKGKDGSWEFDLVLLAGALALALSNTAAYSLL